MGEVLRGDGPERDAFRLVYKRRLENLGLKLAGPVGAADEATLKARSQWPMKADLLVKEISQLHQEGHELRREKHQVQKRNLSEAQLAETQLDAAKRGTSQTRERRDALKKLLSGFVTKGDLLQVEEVLTKKVELLRRETEELTERRKELMLQLQQSQSSQVELQSQVTWELRQASAQQAQSCARQVELKLLTNKLQTSQSEREELYEKHVHVTAQFQAALASARKEVGEGLGRLKQQLLQEEDVAECLGAAADRYQAQVDIANNQLERQKELLQSLPETTTRSTAHEESHQVEVSDSMKSSLSTALAEIDLLKRRVREWKEERNRLETRLSCQKSLKKLQKILNQLQQWHQKVQEQFHTKTSSEKVAVSYQAEMEEMKRLLASQLPQTPPSATVALRVLEAFNEEVPCHSVDLASLLMGSDEVYVVSAVTQLIQAEVRRQAAAIHSSLLESRNFDGNEGMQEAVQRVQDLEKQLLMEVVRSNEEAEDEEIRDLELHLALLVGRRDEVLQRAQACEINR